MGDWTHIAGIIRMDKAYKTVVKDWSEIIPNLTESNYDEIVKYSFNEEYNNPYIEEYKANKAHPFMYPLYKAFIKGDNEVEDDEMDIRIYKEPSESSVVGYTINITADMKYFTNQHLVIDWFCDVCKRINESKYGYIRQACIAIETDTLHTKIYAAYMDNIFEDEEYMLVTEYNEKTKESRTTKIKV